MTGKCNQLLNMLPKMITLLISKSLLYFSLLLLFLSPSPLNVPFNSSKANHRCILNKAVIIKRDWQHRMVPKEDALNYTCGIRIKMLCTSTFHSLKLQSQKNTYQLQYIQQNMIIQLYSNWINLVSLHGCSGGCNRRPQFLPAGIGRWYCTAYFL